MIENFTEKHLENLRKEYATLTRIDPSSKQYASLILMLNTLPKKLVKQLAGAEIKFISMLAKNRI